MVFMVYIHLLLKHKKDKKTLDRLLGSNLELCHRSCIYSINKWNTVLEKKRYGKIPYLCRRVGCHVAVAGELQRRRPGSREAVETATD